MGVLSKRDAASVRRMRDLLERYRPSARAVADELVHELAPAVGAEGAITFRAVRGELGWSAEFLYATADPEPFRDFILQARDGWSPFFPVTPEPLRNRALRTRHIHRHLAKHPTPARKDLLDLVKRLYDPRLNKDDLGLDRVGDEAALVRRVVQARDLVGRWLLSGVSVTRLTHATPAAVLVMMPTAISRHMSRLDRPVTLTYWT